MTDLVFLDTETLGLDPEAPIWEFASIRCRPGLPVERREFFIEHDPTYFDLTTLVAGTAKVRRWVDSLPAQFADDYWARYNDASALTEPTAAEEIHYITNGASVIACNPGFDLERLAKLLRRNGLEPPWHYHPDDITSLGAGFLAGRGHPPARPWKSEQISLAVGVDPAKFKRHTAMGDVLWTQAQYHAITGRVDRPAVIDAAHIAHQRDWSIQTFGPGQRTDGVLDHIAKELEEIRSAPTDLTEWADVIILALDGAQRTGADPQTILDAVRAKQAKNEARTWPDWRTQDPSKAIEHDRSEPFVQAGPISISADGAVIQA